MLSLTKEERQVLIFLLAIALLGLGVDFFRKRYCRGVEIVAGFNCGDAGRIDINTAEKSSLINVSGIGEKIAQRIVEYRQQYGGFSDIEELKKVKGINAYRFEKIKDAFKINKK